MCRYIGHTEVVRGIAKVAGGYATCGWDRTLRIWKAHHKPQELREQHDRILKVHDPFAARKAEVQMSEFERAHPRFKPASLSVRSAQHNFSLLRRSALRKWRGSASTSWQARRCVCITLWHLALLRRLHPPIASLCVTTMLNASRFEPEKSVVCHSALCAQTGDIHVSLLSVLGTYDEEPEEPPVPLLRTARRLNKQLDKLNARLVGSLSPERNDNASVVARVGGGSHGRLPRSGTLASQRAAEPVY